MKLLCWTLNFALVLAFLQAPFLHVHQHESTAKHPGAFLHTHHVHLKAGHSGLEIRDFDPDDDALDQSWFSATITDSGFIAIIFSERLSVEPPQPRFSSAIAIDPIAHSPPTLTAVPPRAPPV
jgi:hypothetical protein